MADRRRVEQYEDEPRYVEQFGTERTNKMIKAAMGYSSSKGGLNVQEIKDILNDNNVHPRGNRKELEEKLKNVLRKDPTLRYLFETEPHTDRYQPITELPRTERQRTVTYVKKFVDINPLELDNDDSNLISQIIQRLYDLRDDNNEYMRYREKSYGYLPMEYLFKNKDITISATSDLEATSIIVLLRLIINKGEELTPEYYETLIESYRYKPRDDSARFKVLLLSILDEEENQGDYDEEIVYQLKQYLNPDKNPDNPDNNINIDRLLDFFQIQEVFGDADLDDEEKNWRIPPKMPTPEGYQETVEEIKEILGDPITLESLEKFINSPAGLTKYAGKE